MNVCMPTFMHYSNIAYWKLWRKYLPNQGKSSNFAFLNASVAQTD